MPVEATLTGYSPEEILPSARWFTQIPGFTVHDYRDNYEPYRYNWDDYKGQKRHAWKYSVPPQVLPPRVEVAFDWAAPTTTFVTFETEKVLERWFLYEAVPNELNFGLTEIYAKSAFNNLDDRGTILEKDTRMEILNRQYSEEIMPSRARGDLYKPHFILCFSGNDKEKLPEEVLLPNGWVGGRPFQLLQRTIGDINIEASRRRMAYSCCRERGGGTPDEINLRKSHCVQRAVDHLMRMRTLIVDEFSDPENPMHLKTA